MYKRQLQHQSVALGQLARGEPRRDSRALGMVLDERHDAVQAPVHGAVVLIGCAEVLAHGRLLEPQMCIRDSLPPSSRLTDAMAATHGVYSRQNTSKPSAASGVMAATRLAVLPNRCV